MTLKTLAYDDIEPSCSVLGVSSMTFMFWIHNLETDALVHKYIQGFFQSVVAHTFMRFSLKIFICSTVSLLKLH
jgi:hypothetical protein